MVFPGFFNGVKKGGNWEQGGNIHVEIAEHNFQVYL